MKAGRQHVTNAGHSLWADAMASGKSTQSPLQACLGGGSSRHDDRGSEQKVGLVDRERGKLQKRGDHATVFLGGGEGGPAATVQQHRAGGWANGLWRRPSPRRRGDDKLMLLNAVQCCSMLFMLGCTVSFHQAATSA